MGEGRESDLGTGRRAVVIEEIASGSAGTTRRARVADPLDRLDLTQQQRQAARIYRQASAHVAAGRGMGPMPYGRDAQGDNGVYGALCAQERAITAADWLRRGVQAMGLAASEGVVHWVVIAELPVTEYDAIRRWRRHTARAQLVAALERLAVEYEA